MSGVLRAGFVSALIFVLLGACAEGSHDDDVLPVWVGVSCYTSPALMADGSDRDSVTVWDDLEYTAEFHDSQGGLTRIARGQFPPELVRRLTRALARETAALYPQPGHVFASTPAYCIQSNAVFAPVSGTATFFQLQCYDGDEASPTQAFEQLVTLLEDICAFASEAAVPVFPWCPTPGDAACPEVGE